MTGREIGVALVVGCAVGAVTLCLGEVAVRKVEAEHADRRRNACVAQSYQLEAATIGDVELADLRARVLYGALDYYTATSCAGMEQPAPTAHAERCYQETRRQSCYLDVARALVQLYRGAR